MFRPWEVEVDCALIKHKLIVEAFDGHHLPGIGVSPQGEDSWPHLNLLVMLVVSIRLQTHKQVGNSPDVIAKASSHGLVAIACGYTVEHIGVKPPQFKLEA